MVASFYSFQSRLEIPRRHDSRPIDLPDGMCNYCNGCSIMVIISLYTKSG